MFGKYDWSLKVGLLLLALAANPQKSTSRDFPADNHAEKNLFMKYEKEEEAEGIKFFSGDWEQAVEKAGREGQLIFMDCYTTWCGPCKMMAKEVFTNPEVASLFNEKFVNVKVDMEKGEGRILKEKYEVHAYPTLNFINGEGKIVHCVVGGVDAETLIKQAELALEGKGLVYMESIYKNGNRDPEFIEQYLTTLDMANLGKESEKVCLEYFANLDKAKLKEKKYWDLFDKYVTDINSDIFTYVYEKREEFEEVYDKVVVENKIRFGWAMGANQFVKGNGDEAVLDKKGFKAYIKRLEKADVKGKYSIIADAKMNNAQKMGDWKTYMKLGEKQLKEGKVGDIVLFNWGLRVNQGCKDMSLRLKAAKWLEDAAVVCAKREADNKGGMMPPMSPHLEKVAADLRQQAK